MDPFVFACVGFRAASPVRTPSGRRLIADRAPAGISRMVMQPWRSRLGQQTSGWWTPTVRSTACRREHRPHGSCHSGVLAGRVTIDRARTPWSERCEGVTSPPRASITSSPCLLAGWVGDLTRVCRVQPTGAGAGPTCMASPPATASPCLRRSPASSSSTAWCPCVMTPGHQPRVATSTEVLPQESLVQRTADRRTSACGAPGRGRLDPERRQVRLDLPAARCGRDQPPPCLRPGPGARGGALQEAEARSGSGRTTAPAPTGVGCERRFR